MSSHPSNANDVFARPRRPVDFHRPSLQARGHDMVPGKQRKYLQLKEKIIGTDKLIQKFREKAKECEEYKQQLKEVQTKLSIEEKGRMGLLAELSVLHHESKSFKSEKTASLAEIERLELSVKEEEMVREQLVTQLSVLKRDKDTSSKLKEELAVTKLEMEKYKRMYQKTKQELDAYRAGQRQRRRRTSEANSLPAPLISPPLSEAGLSPRSTCSLPLPTLPHLITTSNSPPAAAALAIKEEVLSPIIARPPQQVDTQCLSGFDPNADLAVVDDGSTVDIATVNFLDYDSCDTVVKEKNSGVVDGDSDTISKNNDIVDKTNGVQCRPLVQVTHLSDNSDSDSSSEDEQTEHEIPSRTRRPKMPSQSCLDQEVPITDYKTPQDHPQSDSCIGVPVETTLLTTATSKNKCTESTSSTESNSGPSLVDACNSEEQKTSLSQELFGDFDDSLSHLSVSDSSSCCSQSSLGSVDDLADLLCSDTKPYGADDIPLTDNSSAKSNTANGDDDHIAKVGANAEDTQLYNDSDGLEDSVTVVSGDAIGEGAGSDDLVRDGVAGVKLKKDTTFVNLESKDTSEAAAGDVAQTPDLSHESEEEMPCGDDQKELNVTSVATQSIIHHQKSGAIELSSQTQTPPLTVSVSETGVGTTVYEGPTMFLPRIEVEAAPADTASSEDSDGEMDVSFSTLFGEEFRAISPLPPSPFNSHVCRCPSTPLSPLPPSPVKRQPLSPLPQTPHKDLKSISPLPPSPISARPAAISPIPPTPVTLNRAHHEGTSIDSVSPEEVSRDSDTSPVQFDDAAPVDVHVPKPCNLSISIHASSESVRSKDVIVSPIMISSTESPSPMKGTLRVSETSPFSPLTFVLPSESAEPASVFDNTHETTTTPANTVPTTTAESSSSSPPSLSSATIEADSKLSSDIIKDAASLNATSGELAGTTSLDTHVHVEEGKRGNSDEGISTLSLPVIKAEENPDNLINGSPGIISSNSDQAAKLDEVTQTTCSSIEHPRVKLEKKDELVELFGDLSGSSLDLLDEHRPAGDVAPAVPSSSDGCHGNKSPVEEGELEDSSDEEDGDMTKLVPLPIVKNSNQFLPMQISDLPLALNQQKRTPATSIQPHPQVPPPLIINRTSISINRSPQEEGANSPAATFDDLLNTFCPKTRSGGRKAATISTAMYKPTAKSTSVAPSSPEKPTPLAKLLSAARSKPKRTNNQATNKPNAAAFIGVQSAGVTNTSSSLPGCSEKIGCFPAAGKGQKDDRPESRVGAGGNRGKRSVLKRVLSTEEPASKRQKLQLVASDNSQPSSENGATMKEGDKDKELGAFNLAPEATSPQNLPGWDLRTRKVPKFSEWPSRKRKTSSSNGSCVGGGCEERELLPMKKRKKRTTSVACGGPEEAKRKMIKLEPDGDDGCVIKEGDSRATLLVESKLPHLSETVSSKAIVIGENLTSTDLPNTMHTEQTSGHIDNKKPNSKPIHSINNTTVTDTGLSSSASPSSISPPPTMTSILADSSHLDTSSDAGDIDHPLMIGELESLLDGEVFEDDREGSSQSLPSKSRPSSKKSQRPPPLIPKPHVRKTDSATGQEEDQTPASSPKTGPDTVSKHLQSFGEQRNKSTSFATQVPPSLSSSSPHHQAGPVSLPPTAGTQSEAVGYGQPQHTPLPEYKPRISSSLTTNAPQGSKNAAGPSPSSSSSSSSSLANNLDDNNDDDIFNTSLPILEQKSKTISSSATVGQHSGAIGPTRAGGTHQTHGGGGGHQPGVSLAQSALTLCMKSPLPLPQWLVAAMTRVQSKHEHCAASGAGLSKKKRGSAKEPIKRQRSQKIIDYILVNLERLVCGHLHLSTVLTMFTNPHNVPSLQEFISATMKYLLTRYNPKIEHVVSVFHTQCDDVRETPQQMCPLDGGFPPALLRPECQLVALFLQMSQLYPSSAMAPLLVEMNKALYQAMLKPGLKFHKLSALGRILTAICRLQGDADRVLFLAFDLLKKPLTINELPVMAGLASVWPLPLARRRGVKLLDVQRTLLLKGLEEQPLSYTLEVLVMAMMRSEESKGHDNLQLNLRALCQWGRDKPKIPLLTSSLVQLLQTSDSVYIVSSPPPPPPRAPAAVATGPTPWHRPRPSVLAFHIVHCLRAIAHYQGWVWTNDTLIRAHLWPLLQEWNSNQDAVREAAVVCAVRLIGFISQQGLTHDPASSSVGQLQRVFIALLNKSDKISFPVQLAAVDSLLELCPPANPRTQELVGVVKAWLKRQSEKPHGAVLCNEFGPRLQALTIT